ncbi:HPr(Ser) kinase/phosphatase [soil metagenome]
METMALSNPDSTFVASAGDRERVSLREFCKEAPNEADIKVIAGSDGFDKRFITSDRIQKLGLALTGFNTYVHQGRIQMIGQSELSFLADLTDDQKRESIASLPTSSISCFLITKGLTAPEELVEVANEHQIPLVSTPLVSSKAISSISEYLQRRLAQNVTIHGVLIEMQGIGVLITGESGIGKSECALELITRGHRLVADDAVQIKQIGNCLEGAAPELTSEFLEIRGLGVVNIRELFGISSVCSSINIELCIELTRWEDGLSFERLGIDKLEHNILGFGLRKFLLPVRPGRNLTTLVETAVKLFLLERTGANPAIELTERHDKLLLQNTA